MFKELKKDFNKIFTTSILTSIVFIALGVFLLVRPGTTIRIISYTLGTIIILLGSISFGKYFSGKTRGVDFNLIYGSLCTIMGLVIILNPNALATLIPFILGFWIVINSIIKIQYSLNLREHNSNAYISTLIIGILTLLWGLILVFNPFSGAIAITQMIGIFIIVYSILDLIESTLLHRNIKKFSKNVKKGVKKITKIIEED